VAVENCRDLAGATGTAGATLAELGTGLGIDTDFGHGECSPGLRGGDGTGAAYVTMREWLETT